MRTVRNFTGIPVNHVAVVDFATSRTSSTRSAGSRPDNPKPILSNRFDCPTQDAGRCAPLGGLALPEGQHHLDGHHALIYSRVRENRLDPARPISRAASGSSA